MALLVKSLLACILLSASNPLLAWGRTGHRVIGSLAHDHLSMVTRLKLYQLLETSEFGEITDWCNWPDLFRATDAGAWTAPLHFVNIPQGAGGYVRSRDCSDDQCVTEAIARFSSELENTGLPVRQRREAYGFVCHFVGDLSQPLHAGFAFDRGGNEFSIIFNGAEQSLHGFWDFTLINSRHEEWNTLRKLLLREFRIIPSKNWEVGVLVEWTDESHHLARTRVYPDDPVITQQYTDESWHLIRRRLVIGGRNLATVLNSVLR